MGNMSKRQQLDQRADNSRRPLLDLQLTLYLFGFITFLIRALLMSVEKHASGVLNYNPGIFDNYWPLIKLCTSSGKMDVTLNSKTYK